MILKMRSPVQAVMLTSETGEFTEEVRRAWLDIQKGVDAGTPVGECSPALDVFETEDSVEIRADLPGVPAEAVRVIAKGSAVLIVGEKAPRRRWSGASFHLVERGFGRFARLVRLSAPCEMGQAHATLADGELRVTIPKRPERRGRTVRIPVTCLATST